MDFFDLSNDFKPIVLKGGQTQGYVKVDDEDFDEDGNIESKEGGLSYVKEYLEKEAEEEKTAAEAAAASPKGDMSLVELTSVGTFPDCNEIVKEDMTQVYDTYFKDKPKMTNNLIINEYRTKILSMIELNEAIIITGPTGCGKTTQVPQFILDHHSETNKYCNVIVTQPRRIAAISIAKRVCEERDWSLGTICGYKIGLKNCTSDDTRLTYVTVGVFLQMLINAKHMNTYTHVILDEIHERDQTMDFALLVVRKLLQSNSKNVKVILMSATADVGKFATYFQKKLMERLEPAPVVNIGRTTNYLVQVHYLEELSPLGQLPEINIEEPHVSEMTMLTCVKLIKQFERLDEDTTEKKSVLVFLPGIYEIENLFNKLKDPKISSPGHTQYKWFPVPLHSSITAEEQALAFRPPPTGHRKIILATNIAESSITVPDVMFVIDFCLTKVLVTDSTTNFTCLQLCWASKTNCIQRAGRAGRVMEGRVYRMVYKDFYQKLDEECVPGMLRCPLEKVVLQSKLLDMGCPKAILALALDPPDLSNIQRTIFILKEVGGLLLSCQGVPSVHDGDLTCLGRLMALLPVDIHITRLILLGHLFSCLDECIIMGAAMSLKSVFSSPFQARLKSYNSKLEWADGSCSDCIAFLNVYDVWKLNQRNGYFKRSAGGGELNWAKRHFIQLRSLKEVEFLVDELTKRLKMHNIEKTVGVGRVNWNDMEKAFVLKFVIAGAFYPNYFGRGARGGQVSEELAVKTLGGRDPFTSVYLQNYPSEQPPELYSHLIKEKLAECKEDMKISYDNSKVFIEFRKQGCQLNSTDLPFNSEVPGKISMSVYRAVKMRQTMKYMEIKAMPPEQAKATAQRLGLDKSKDLFSVPLPRETWKDKLFQATIPGIDINFIDIKITHIVDPGHFWAMTKDGVNERHEKEIFDWLNTSGEQLEAYSKVPEVGEMCVAPYEEGEETFFYRARVDAIQEIESNKRFAQVFFIDYGNTEMIPVSRLLNYGSKLHLILSQIPALCYECVLTKVKPSIMKNPYGKWSKEAKEEFSKMTRNSEFVASVYSVVKGVVSVVLYKVTDVGSNHRQVNINQHLINTGYAEEVEESYLSKANNELRNERQLNSEQRNVYNILQINHEWKRKSFEPPDLQNCKLTLKLGGPFSPLEMKIFSLTRGGLSKHVTVAPSSVNSVLLDSDPQDPHERLVVAAHVCQNQTGNNLILHQTTMLPNIHGLAALIPFVFAPTVELRVDAKRSKYTGVLCGLGVDKNDRPMFPEHDMEVVFDCEFSFDDFSTVNRLRFFMSLLLLTDGVDPNPVSSHPDVVTFQNHIKTALMKLIDKRRKSQDLEFPKKEFKWGLVKPDLLVKNNTAVSYSKLSVFPLHPGISIVPRDKKNLLTHIENLTALARARLEPATEVECEICEMKLANLTAVRLHLATEGHKKKEDKLRNSIES